MYLLAGTCAAASEVDGMCNDDGADGLGSSLTAAVTAGTTYFLVVDNYGAITETDEQNGTTLTISVE
jgi:hypothetical protein